MQERRKEIEKEAMTYKNSQIELERTEKEIKNKLAKFKTELDDALKVCCLSFKLISNFSIFNSNLCIQGGEQREIRKDGL